LKLGKGKPDIGIYISILQVIIRNIQKLKNTTLEDSRMVSDNVNQLRDPRLTHCTLDMSDTYLLKVLWHFIYSTNTSHDYYKTIWKVDMVAYPGDKFLSFD
jgi:hypothetical protein